MSTYSKNGAISGRFDKTRHDEYDTLGKKNAKCFFESKGYKLIPNDKDEKGDTIYDRTDLLAIVESDQSVKIPIECSVKRTDLWRYIFEGVDIEFRKEKYGEYGYNCMSNDDGSEILLIPLLCVKMAVKSCGDNYKGGRGVNDSSGFLMPEHGCHRVRKPCYKGKGQTGSVEDFTRTPYKYIYHFKKHKNIYNLEHEPEDKLNIKDHISLYLK